MLEPGDTLNHGAYRILKELGAGGFGVVYLAEEAALGSSVRSVAIKTILSEVALRDRHAAEGLLNEARVSAGLDHPGIVPVHYVGQEPVRGHVVHYIVMEYVQGGDLETVLSMETVNLGQRLRWMRQIAEGLAHAHQQGFVHRDLKLRNILLSRNGNVKIGDFGLAKAVGTETKTITKGLGTPGYISPEQIENRTTDFRSDVYSLGVMYYQMLTGRLPYDAPDVSDSTAKAMAIFYQHVNAPVPSARFLNPAVPAELDQLVRQMMAKSPADRPANAAEVTQLLERVALAESTGGGGPRWSGWATVVAAILAVAATGFFVVPKIRHAQVPPDPGQLQRLVADKLGDASLKLRVDVSPEQIATLTGQVTSLDQKEQAVRLARAVPGVKDVRDNIEVVVPPPTPADLERRVAASLTENGLRLRVVASSDGMVVLTGNVLTAEQKAQAVRLARAVPGVKTVEDHIAIAAVDPDEIELRVERSLRENGLSNLRVMVSRARIVTLTGVVKTNVDRDRAIKLALVPGVVRVEARINCTQGPGCWSE